MSFKILSLFLCFISFLFSQPTNVQLAGVTSTQAILSYTAPSANACTLEVSENSGLTPLINDVNSTLFTSADEDSRFSSLASGLQRKFIIGLRTSDTALNDKLYSRALAENTLYYYELTCDGNSVTGTFITPPISWGSLKPEAPPMNPDGFLRAAWPTIDWSDRYSFYVDPQTGLKYKPLGYPSDYAWTYPNDGTQFLFGDGRISGGSGWSNLTNIRSGTTGSVATTSNTNPVFVGFDPSVTLIFGQSSAGMEGKPISLDNVQVQIYGSGSDATSTNREVTLCISLDWSTCYTDNITITLPSGADASVGGFPADGTFKTSPFFNGWGKPVSRYDFARAGTVNVATNTVSLASGDGFNPNWVYGTRVWISGSDPTCGSNLCTISSVESPSSMTIVESLTLTGSTYEQAVAVKIAKTNATGSINISVANKATTSLNWQIPPGGSIDACSYVKVSFSVDRDGNPATAKSGTMCSVEGGQSGTGGIYWLADDGESRLITVFRIPNSVVNSANPLDQPVNFEAYPFMLGFSPTVGTRWFTQARCGATAYRCIYQLDYTGDGRAWAPSPLYPLVSPQQTQPASPSDNVSWTNLTLPSAGMDLDSQIAAEYPQYDSARWGTLLAGVDGVGTTGNYFVITKLAYGVGEGPIAYIFVFSLLDGSFVRAWDSYTGTLSEYFRWSAHHATLGFGTGTTDGIILQSFNPNRQIWGGYTSTTTHVWRSGAWSTDSSLPATYDGTYDGTCPANSYGAVSPNCVKIRVSGQPCKNPTLTNEEVYFPCPWDAGKATLSNLEVGDMFADSGNYSETERLRVLEVTVNSTTDIEITAQRDAVPVSKDPRCSGSRTHSDNWVIEMSVGGGRVCGINTLFINPATGAVSASPLFDHHDLGVGPTLPYRWVSSAAYADGGLAQLDTTFPPIAVPYNPLFAGATTNTIPPFQSYPSGRQWTAESNLKNLTLDQRHFTDWGPQTLTNILGNLHRVSLLGTVDMKRVGWIVNASGNILTELNPGTTGDTITPSDTWRYCYAYRNDECRTGSTAGQMFVVVPSPANAYCGQFSLTSNAICAIAPNSIGSWGVQAITTQNNSRGRFLRRLTMQPGPQRQTEFENIRSTPDGKFFVFRNTWTDGLYTTTMIGRLSTPITDTTNRTTWVPVDVKIGSGVVTDNAIIKFWYDEFGGYCSSRQENCYATAASITEATPYLLTHELLSGSGVSCASGCTIKIPSTSNRILYYQVVNNASGVLTDVGSIQVVGIK